MVPAATAMKAAAISGPFGSTIATRSPRPMPRALRLAIVRSVSARRAWNVSGTPPGLDKAGAASAPAWISS